MPKIAAGATNKNISIAPHGTGKVVVGTGAADATVQSDGDHNLILQTGNSTTSKIEINDGANGDVAITPNGTGNLTIDNIAISDNTIISTDTNGNIDLTPNGTGEVNISKVDIDSGAIDGTTIATSDVTVGSGKTLDVSAGTLTSSTAQKQAIVDGADIEGTAVDSTGESGATKFLRENGDGTCSWQTASGSDSLPSQTGNADKLLTTNGTAASWTNAPINLIKLAFAGQSSAPGAPSAGTLYYNSTKNLLYVYNGTAWVVLSNQGYASGGIETYYSDSGTNYVVHSFLSSGVFWVEQVLSVDVLVVAGGGAGSQAGGGAGGYRHLTSQTISAGSYAVTVGGGGAGVSGAAKGGDGGDSSFIVDSGTITSTGGGGGAYYNDAPGTGGSGGGGRTNGSAAGGSGNTPSTTPAQGRDGGDGAGSGATAGGGGGGGATDEGADATTSAAGAGGNGTANTLRDNTSVTYAGGGGGGRAISGDGGAAGGTGGGGAGTVRPAGTPVDGTVNTGGGGGADGSGGLGGNGGSGIIIVRYAI